MPASLSTLKDALPLDESDNVDRKQCEVVVLGAGVSGLTAAHDLVRAGHSVSVVEQAAQCGGTHRSCSIGSYTFDSGSIFFERTHPMFSMFTGLSQVCIPVIRRQKRICPQGGLLHYPFDNDEVMAWPAAAKMRALSELAYYRTTLRSPANAEDYCLSRMGRTVYERSGLSHYLQRFHGVPAAEIDVEFCRKRMKFIEKRSNWASLAEQGMTLLRKKANAPRPPLLVRPKEGFGAFYDRVRQQLTALGVQFFLNAPVSGFQRVGGRYAIQTSQCTLVCDKVISAIPIDAMHRIALARSTGLDVIDIVTLFVSSDQLPEGDTNVLFNFHGQGRWKRATFYSRIYGQAEGRDYSSVEVTVNPEESGDPEALFEDFRRHVSALGLFGDDLVLEGSDRLEAAYPFYRRGFTDIVSKAARDLADLGIISVGRQGMFEYLPVSSQAIARTRVHMKEAGLDLMLRDEGLS